MPTFSQQRAHLHAAEPQRGVPWTAGSWASPGNQEQASPETSFPVLPSPVSFCPIVMHLVIPEMEDPAKEHSIILGLGPLGGSVG